MPAPGSHHPLIWSFDIRAAGREGIRNAVGAVAGEVVKTRHESGGQEAAEAAGR